MPDEKKNPSSQLNNVNLSVENVGQEKRVFVPGDEEDRESERLDRGVPQKFSKTGKDPCCLRAKDKIQDEGLGEKRHATGGVPANYEDKERNKNW